MNLETTRLLLFVRNAISPQTFNSNNFSDETLLVLKSNFQQEISGVQIAFHSLLKPTLHSDRRLIINQLVSISDIVNHYLCKLSVLWKAHPHADMIKSLYLFILTTLDELIGELGDADLIEFDQIRISDFGLRSRIMLLKEQLSKLKQRFKDLPIDDQLRQMLYGILSQYIRKKGLTRGDFNYLQAVMNRLLAEQQITTKRLMDLLVVLDVSVPEFLLYYLEHWKKSVLSFDSLHDQLETTIHEIDSMNFLALNTRLRRPGGIRPLHEEVSKYLREKKEILVQLIASRREFLKDQKEAMEATRFQINLPVAQLGLLIRLLLEKGILLKENLGGLFSFFANHFYTPKTLYISAESLQKKSSDIEFSTALKLKGVLIAMLNYLNANFNLSNYSV